MRSLTPVAGLVVKAEAWNYNGALGEVMTPEQPRRRSTGRGGGGGGGQRNLESTVRIPGPGSHGRFIPGQGPLQADRDLGSTLDFPPCFSFLLTFSCFQCPLPSLLCILSLFTNLFRLHTCLKVTSSTQRTANFQRRGRNGF